jgi:hypothetical protein
MIEKKAESDLADKINRTKDFVEGYVEWKLELCKTISNNLIKIIRDRLSSNEFTLDNPGSAVIDVEENSTDWDTFCSNLPEHERFNLEKELIYWGTTDPQFDGLRGIDAAFKLLKEHKAIDDYDDIITKHGYDMFKYIDKVYVKEALQKEGVVDVSTYYVFNGVRVADGLNVKEKRSRIAISVRI